MRKLLCSTYKLVYAIMQVTRKRILTAVANLICIAAQLVITYLMTNVIPMPDFLYDPSDERFMGKYPKPEPLYEMILTLWVIPLVWLSIIHLALVRWQPVKTATVILAWFQTVVLTIFITGLFRYFLPEPRPFFTTICRPKVRYQGYLFENNMCSAEFERRDIQSFPSGHSSSVVSSWVFVILVGLFGSGTFRKGHHSNSLYKMTLFLLPALVVPIYVCSERIRSGNHTWYQVLFGSLIGIGVAFLVFYSMDRSAMTHSPRSAETDLEAQR